MVDDDAIVLAELRNCELDGTACRAMKNERG